MISNIKTIQDIQTFAKELISEGVSFHPDDDFKDYVSSKENKPTYSNEEAQLRNRLMSQCFDVCEKEGCDVYSIMLDVTLVETGMDKFIPMSSTQPD